MKSFGETARVRLFGFVRGIKMELEQDGIIEAEFQWDYGKETRPFWGGNMSRKSKLRRESTKKTARILQQNESKYNMASSDNAENDFVEVPDNDDEYIFQLPGQIGNFFPVLVDSTEQKQRMEVDEEIVNKVKDDIDDENDDYEEHAIPVDVFNGSMDRQVKFGDMIVSEDAVCQDVNLFAQLWPNLASEFLVENWRFYKKGVREEREKTLSPVIQDPRLISSLFSALSSDIK